MMMMPEKPFIIIGAINNNTTQSKGVCPKCGKGWMSVACDSHKAILRCKMCHYEIIYMRLTRHE